MQGLGCWLVLVEGGVVVLNVLFLLAVQLGVLEELERRVERLHVQDEKVEGQKKVEGAELVSFGNMMIALLG